MASNIKQLSPHFTLAEAILSQQGARAGLDNTPPDSVITVMQEAARHMEIVRSILSAPITVSSWYRSPEVNALVGSKPTSQHRKGEAIDFISPTFGDPLAICRKIIEYKNYINYDQLILEHTWVHISFSITGGKARNQVLSLLQNGGYASGLTDKLGNKL